MLTSLDARSGLAFAHLIIEALDIEARNSADPQPSKQRLDVTLDAPAIGCKGGRLFREPSPSKKAPRLTGPKVGVAQLGDRLSLSAILLFFGWVRPSRDCAKNAPGFGSRKFRGLGRAMPAYGMPALGVRRSCDTSAHSRRCSPCVAERRSRALAFVPLDFVQRQPGDRLESEHGSFRLVAKKRRQPYGYHKRASSSKRNRRCSNKII